MALAAGAGGCSIVLLCPTVVWCMCCTPRWTSVRINDNNSSRDAGIWRFGLPVEGFGFGLGLFRVLRLVCDPRARLALTDPRLGLPRPLLVFGMDDVL